MIKQFYQTIPLLLGLLLSIPGQAQFTVDALDQFGDLGINKVHTGKLSLSPNPADWDDHGNLLFSVLTGPNAGLWEYDYEGDALYLLEALPGITSLAPHYSPWGPDRYVYYGQFTGGNTEVARYNGIWSRPYMRFDDLMLGMTVTDWLYSGDFVTWGADATGWYYDQFGNIVNPSKNGSIQALVHPSSGLQHRSWGIVFGSVNLGTIYRDFNNLGNSAVVAAMGVGPTEPATDLYRTDGISTNPLALSQPPANNITLMTTVPVPEDDTERVFVGGRFDVGNGMENALIYYDAELVDWSLYTLLPNYNGIFKVSARIEDADGNDALVIGGKIDMAAMGYPADYSGLFVVNLSGVTPIEELITDGVFLEVGSNIPDFSTLDYDPENKILWAAGKNIQGKDAEGDGIETGFVIHIGDMEGNIFAPTTNVVEVSEEEIGLRISPNPGPGMFEVSVSSGNIEKVTVYDLLGQVIETTAVNAANTEVNLMNESDGIYILQLDTAEGQLSKRVVKMTR